MGEVIYCAFGSQCTLDQSQFQDLVLGLELTCICLYFFFFFQLVLKPWYESKIHVRLLRIYVV
ncbi:hypothetical protein RND81_13G037400 [Saponaria officinalis]|uniref:Uncharacterized protein n=1 Tax=Saponaria officinalis TaxID=3572 RepID=A0AAW1H3Y1_SAPOF